MMSPALSAAWSEHHPVLPSMSACIRGRPSHHYCSSYAWTRPQPTFRRPACGRSYMPTMSPLHLKLGQTCNTKQWKTRLDENGMRLNIRKTEYMERGSQTDGTISIDGVDLRKTEEFKYLGSVLSQRWQHSPSRQSPSQCSVPKMVTSYWCPV